MWLCVNFMHKVEILVKLGVEYAKLGNFCLTEDEKSQISLLNCNHKLYLESLICPGF